MKELKEDEFADLYAEELQAAGEAKISGENFVDECQVESDLELLFPNEYIHLSLIHIFMNVLPAHEFSAGF